MDVRQTCGMDVYKARGMDVCQACCADMRMDVRVVQVGRPTVPLGYCAQSSAGEAQCNMATVLSRPLCNTPITSNGFESQRESLLLRLYSGL